MKKEHEHAKDFGQCEICNCDVSDLDFDSPLYCEKCIAGMEKLDMSPKKYRKYLELQESMGK